MKSVTQAVKTMPDNMLNTVDGVMDNISKLFGNAKKNDLIYENAKVGASIDTEVIDYFYTYKRKEIIVRNLYNYSNEIFSNILDRR